MLYAPSDLGNIHTRRGLQYVVLELFLCLHYTLPPKESETGSKEEKGRKEWEKEGKGG